MKYFPIIILLLPWQLLLSQGLFESAGADSTGGLSAGPVEFSGYARGSAWGGLGSYDFSSVFGEFTLRTDVDHKGAYLHSDIRFRQAWYYDAPATEFDINEAYAGYKGEKVDALMGMQIISWGRTDGFNPTNCITPNNYFFLSANPDDQLMSNFMLRLKIRFHPRIELELIGIPLYRPSVYRYELFEFEGDVSFEDPLLPERSFKNGSAAARLNFELDRIGFSFSAFHGYDPYYGFDVTAIDLSTGTPVITNAASPYLRNSLGTDVALPLASWIIRAEASWRHTSDFEAQMYIPNPDISYVLGIEKSFGSFLTILQYVGKHTLEYSALAEPVLSDPMNPMAQAQYAMEMVIYNSSLFNRRIFQQQEAFNHAASLTLNKSFAYDSWNVELSGYYNFTSEEYLLRPKLSWSITDALQTSAGLYYMAGPEEQLFNYAGPVLSGAFLEFKVSF